MPIGLTTGSPAGVMVVQEDLYISDAPYIFIQDYLAPPLFNPDAQGYYWNLTGTTAYPVSQLGCVLDVSLSENITLNDVMCDTVGTVDAIQRREYIELTLTIQSFFPLAVASQFMNLSTAVVGSGYEKVGIGGINNNKHYMVYMPKVYDEDTNDYIVIHLHKAKFVDAWTIGMATAEPWKLTGVKIRAFADTSKPSKQKFGTILRFDSDALP